jgi:hypothetical protein
MNVVTAALKAANEMGGDLGHSITSGYLARLADAPSDVPVWFGQCAQVCRGYAARLSALADDLVRAAEGASTTAWPAPRNACRMCSGLVAWSPLCSACCEVVERVHAAIVALGGTATRGAIGQRLADQKFPCSPAVVAMAISELCAREVATLSRGGSVRLARPEAA